MGENKYLKATFVLAMLSTFCADASSVFTKTFELSVGQDHVCAQTSLGIRCFGNSERVTLQPPKAGTKPRFIRAGNRFSCMIVDEGVKCWGEIPNTTKREILISKKTLSNPRLLAVGYGHACAVSEKDKIICWGGNNFGESIPPRNLTSITEISLGMNNSCVIANGSVSCWGMSSIGSIDVPYFLKNPRNLTSGQWHHCVQTDEGVKCWGYPYTNFVPPDDETIQSFTSGGFDNCALVNEGVKCWNESGKTKLVDDSLGAYKLSMGFTNACAVTTDRGVICWQLNISSNKASYKLLQSFVPAGGISKIENISAGHASICAYGDQNNIKCWGFNPAGALDVPTTIPGPITKLSVGPHKTCTIVDSILNCWGDRDSSYNTPKDLGNVSFVSSGGLHVCAATSDQIKCWGENIRGALDVPKKLTNISQISSGFSHVCVIANTQVNCWGGEGLIKNINPNPKLVNIKSVCAGGTFSCAISNTGKIKCWGDQVQFVGDTKKIDGTSNNVLNIPKVLQTEKVTEVSCGLSHACAIYNGKIKCWGDSYFLPERLLAPAIKNPRQLSAGWNHTCALGDAGLSCWGTMLNMEMPAYSLIKEE